MDNERLFLAQVEFSTQLRVSLNTLLAWPFFYNHHAGEVWRSDRMSAARIRSQQSIKSGVQPATSHLVDPATPLMTVVAERACGGDDAKKRLYLETIYALQDELLDGDTSPAARMIVTELVLVWCHSLLADAELAWESHRVGICPAAMKAQAIRSEVLGKRFHSSVRLWTSYVLRTRGKTPCLPEARRLKEMFAGMNRSRADYPGMN